MSEAWSNTEVELIIADYFLMLENELKGILYNKTQHRNMLKQLLNNRSDGSIEFKHQNISAVLVKLGLPFIKGYKPRWNFQKVLEEKVIDYISSKKSELELSFIKFADSIEINQSVKYSFGDLIHPPPEKNIISEPQINISNKRNPIKTNYLLREQNNATLGEKGEALIIEYEKWRLITEGKEAFADKVEWISKTDDGAGFDILSKNTNGTDRYIEVKTTKLSKETPIFFSRNEYDVSREKRNQYFLYRLYDFNDKPKMFNFNGDFDSFCTKEAVQYKGFF